MLKVECWSSVEPSDDDVADYVSTLCPSQDSDVLFFSLHPLLLHEADLTVSGMTANFLSLN